MILRKPYAFLMKHFRLINLALFALVLFMLTRVLSLYSFVKDYLNTNIYNVTLVPISKYINTYVYIALILIILICGLLSYLLKRKDKPFIAYIYITIIAILTLILDAFVNNYFTFTAANGYNEQMARLMRDLTLINSFIYYPALLILLIRFTGIDLNSFGFKEDKEFLDDEADREEIEVEVTFDKYKYIRIFKNKLRYTKYFIREHLYAIIPIFIVVALIAGYNTYKYIFVEHKVYKQNEIFYSNGYDIKINKTYLTDKDYAGNTISSQKRFFVVVDASVRNYSIDREFDSSKLALYIDNNSYTPTVSYNRSFVDLGTPYTKMSTIARGKTKNYLFIYEVDKPNEKANFLLKFQDLISKDKKQIRIKLNMLDISEFKDRETALLDNELTVWLNNNDKYSFTFSDFEITDNKIYTYEACNYNYRCPIYENTLTSGPNKKILFLKFMTNIETNEFIEFIKKYGKIQYMVDNKDYYVNIKYKINKYRGNYLYLEVPSDIENASDIKFVFTIRTNRYFYKVR